MIIPIYAQGKATGNHRRKNPLSELRWWLQCC